MKVQEKTLIKISLLVFIFSFFALFIIEKHMEVTPVLLSSISSQDVNTVVSTKATLVKQSQFNTTLFLTLQNKATTMPAIVFDVNKSPLEKYDEYLFTGKVVFYENELELLVLEIKPIP